MQEKREEWKELIKEIPKDKLVFLDESGVNTNLVRRYGRSVGKTRVVDNAPFSTPRSTTVLSAIRQDGQFACMTFEGGTTKERFREYLETVLLPSMAWCKILCKRNSTKSRMVLWKQSRMLG